MVDHHAGPRGYALAGVFLLWRHIGLSPAAASGLVAPTFGTVAAGWGRTFAISAGLLIAVGAAITFGNRNHGTVTTGIIGLIIRIATNNRYNNLFQNERTGLLRLPIFLIVFADSTICLAVTSRLSGAMRRGCSSRWAAIRSTCTSCIGAYVCHTVLAIQQEYFINGLVGGLTVLALWYLVRKRFCLGWFRGSQVLCINATHARMGI